jgi:hypothetical protein
MSTLDVLVTIPFCTGTLRVLRRREPLQYYYSGESKTATLDVQVVFHGDEGAEVVVASPEELVSLAHTRHCDIEAAVSEHAADFAFLFYVMLGLNRVISSLELFQSLQGRVSFELRDNLPRVEHGALVFLTYSPQAEQKITQVRIDLRSGALGKCSFP